MPQIFAASRAGVTLEDLPRPRRAARQGTLLNVHLIDGTYELFRHYYALPPAKDAAGREVAAVRGVVSSVLGLITAWGTVALHGREGFRAQHASVTCLFTDWAGSAPVPRLTESRFERWSRRVFDRYVERAPRAGQAPNPERLASLREVGGRYAVPLVSLRGALRLRVLGEWGIPQPQIQEAEAWVAAVAAPAGDG